MMVLELSSQQPLVVMEWSSSYITFITYIIKVNSSNIHKGEPVELSTKGEVRICRLGELPKPPEECCQ